MGLTSDLISEFVKITNDKKEVKKETTVYATIVEHDGKTYAKLDGSDRLTPISTTADANDGERVTVMIKNHTAMVTGNISSPAARTDDVKDAAAGVAEVGNKITEMEIAIADKVDTKQLNAEKARIDVLQSENVTIKNELSAQKGSIAELEADNATINNKLTANEASITKLQTEKLDAEIADLTYATISELDATNANLHNLESTYGEFASLTAEQLEAMEAAIAKLEAGEITVDQLKAIFATIEQLNAEKARIDDLEAEVGDIDTLIFGSATGETIQTSFANAVIAQLGNAQIKSAMIESMAADKITSGDIITNNVRVVSEDGKLLISDETIQISDNTRVRVQIGKDAAGDYSINIWDAEGNLMFSEGGITDSAIKEAIIRNDMVSDTANIAAHKLDIDSLFEEINGSAKTIKATRIYLDDKGQTLDVAFESMSSDIEEIQNGVSSQGTAISVIQGQIASKVWQQDINTVVNEVNETTDNLSTQYEEIVQDVDGLTATVSNHTSEISKKADSSTVTEVSDKVASMETDLSGFKTTVSETYATKTEVSGLSNRMSVAETSITQHTTAIELRATKTELTEAIDDIAIGGRNLILNSAEPINTTAPADYNYQYLTFIPTVLPLADGEPYTISADVEVLAGEVTVISVKLYNDTLGTQYAEVLPDIVNGHIEGTFDAINAGASRVLLYAGVAGSTAGNSVTFSNIKFEKGNKATDWTPAPEDVNNAIDTAQVTADEAQNTATSAEERATSAESLIQLLSESIAMLVTDGNGQSLMTQTDNGWTFSTGELQSIVDSTSENLDALTNEVGDIDSAVGILQKAVDDLGVLSEYVKITTYEGEPCIELGETDSDFKLLITNTRIMFMEGTGVPAYITNQALHIKKAVVEEELQQGEFVWKARSNGNLGLIWKGATS